MLVPEEVFEMVLMHLDAVDLAAASAVSRRWRRLAADDWLWRKASRLSIAVVATCMEPRAWSHKAREVGAR